MQHVALGSVAAVTHGWEASDFKQKSAQNLPRSFKMDSVWCHLSESCEIIPGCPSPAPRLYCWICRLEGPPSVAELSSCLKAQATCLHGQGTSSCVDRVVNLFFQNNGLLF